VPSNPGLDQTTLYRLRELRQELLSTGILAHVDRILAKLVPPEPGDTEGPNKIVKDLVWGIVSIPGFLVPLVNSRLLQRQRRVRQLGLSYLVYPSAGYSRFEHALGCCHVMSQLLNAAEGALGRLPEEAQPASITPSRRKQLLLGALLHDAGHMPFSHASEECVEEFASGLKFGDKPVSEVLSLVADVVEKDLKLAELISILVIISPRFQQFMRPIAPPTEERSVDFFLEVAAFVAGARLATVRSRIHPFFLDP